MATRKVKRYADEGFVESGSGSDDALERANNSEESQAIANEARGEAILKNMRDSDAAKEVKADIKNQVKANKASSSKDYGGSSGTGKYAPAPASTPSKAESKPAARVGRAGQATATAPGERSTATKENQDAANARRAETRSNMMDSVFGRFLRSTGSQRSRPYQKETGMKSGGMTASKRADGIAQRGKTRGKMC